MVNEIELLLIMALRAWSCKADDIWKIGIAEVFASLRLQEPLLGQSDDIVPISGYRQHDLLVRSQHMENAPYFYFKRNISLPY